MKKFSLYDLEKSYMALKRANKQYNDFREIILEQLLGEKLAAKALPTVFTSSDLLYFLKETQAWNEEEKFLNEFIRLNKFKAGAKYAVFSNTGWIQMGTATIYSRLFLNNSWYATVISNIDGKKSVNTYKIKKYVGKNVIEVLPIKKDYIIYADREDDKTEEPSNRN